MKPQINEFWKYLGTNLAKPYVSQRINGERVIEINHHIIYFEHSVCNSIRNGDFRHPEYWAYKGQACPKCLNLCSQRCSP